MRSLLIFPLLLGCAAVSYGQAAAWLAPAQAQALAQRALAAELRLAPGTVDGASHPMRYQLAKTTPRLSSTKEIIETRDGDVARLLSADGRPLSPAAEEQEQARLEALLNDPSQQRHRQQSEASDSGLVFKLLRMLPHAFLYTYEGPGVGPSGAVEKFSFRPNPDFAPPDMETQALTAMNGEIWIDSRAARVTRLEGHLEQDTSYGWGILGKLNKGGWVVLEQADVGGGQWRMVRVQMKMDLRILFKTRKIDTTEVMSGYAPVPHGIDYRQAIRMLRGSQ